ncbi:MAG: hypothetical protein AAGF83_26045 [Cyanobacteria bacterium P01_G01_bin.67]
MAVALQGSVNSIVSDYYPMQLTNLTEEPKSDLKNLEFLQPSANLCKNRIFFKGLLG